MSDEKTDVRTLFQICADLPKTEAELNGLRLWLKKQGLALTEGACVDCGAAVAYARDLSPVKVCNACRGPREEAARAEALLRGQKYGLNVHLPGGRKMEVIADP